MVTNSNEMVSPLDPFSSWKHTRSDLHPRAFLTAGFFGYSHFTGGFPGGQAEYVRVPFGDVNCLPIPDDVSDEKGKSQIQEPKNRK